MCASPYFIYFVCETCSFAPNKCFYKLIKEKMIMFVKKFIKNKITLGGWDNKLIEIFTDLKRFELTKAYQKLQCELNELHEIELYDRLDKIKNLQNQINFKLDTYIEKSRFRSFTTKIFIRGKSISLVKKINKISAIANNFMNFILFLNFKYFMISVSSIFIFSTYQSP